MFQELKIFNKHIYMVRIIVQGVQQMYWCTKLWIYKNAWLIMDRKSYKQTNPNENCKSEQCLLKVIIKRQLQFLGHVIRENGLEKLKERYRRCQPMTCEKCQHCAHKQTDFKHIHQKSRKHEARKDMIVNTQIRY